MRETLEKPGTRGRHADEGVGRRARALLHAIGALILACGCGVAGAQTPPALVPADDLVPLASQSMVKGIPIMLVFTESDCPFCARAKKEHLEPLAVSADYGPKVIIREVDVRSEAPIRDFDGKTMSQSDFARRYDIRSVPTIITFTGSGQRVAEPLVGLLIPDFYTLYIHRQIDDGRLIIRRATQPQ